MTYINKNKKQKEIQEIINYRIGITPLLLSIIVKEIQSEYQQERFNTNNNN